MASSESLYFGREQTQVKHEVLRLYLERFALIIGSWKKSITYIDGFAGPWNAVSGEWKDSSFSIAMSKLREARAVHRAKGKDFRIRCFFVESNPRSFAALEEFRQSQRDDVEIAARNAELEDVVQDCVAFAKKDRDTFAFSFIDPTGWKGIALETIRPLLKLQPGEVLVNLMTSHIIRHINNPSVRSQIAAVFGSARPLERIDSLRGIARIDACVEEYCAVLKSEGGFEYVAPAVVLQPTKNRPHFFLIYGSRKAKGLEVFKDAERHAMDTMEAARAAAEERERGLSGQRSFLEPVEMPKSRYYTMLRSHYIESARREVLAAAAPKKRLAYDIAWAIALSKPLVWESDLKEWIAGWRKDGSATLEGLKNERVPKRGKGHELVWLR